MIKYRLSVLVSKLIFILYLLTVTSCCATKTAIIKYEPRVVKTKNELVTEYMKAVEVLRYYDLLEYERGKKKENEN